MTEMAGQIEGRMVYMHI